MNSKCKDNPHNEADSIPKKIVLISSKEIEEKLLCGFRFLTVTKNNLYIYSTVNTSFSNVFQKEYSSNLILEGKNMNFYVWINRQDDILMNKGELLLIHNLINYCKGKNDEPSEKNKNKNKMNNILANDTILFLYFLFDEYILQRNYSYYYKIIINALVLILEKTEQKTEDASQFSYDKDWICFFNWLHEIEPSILYSFFLIQYCSKNSISMSDILKLEMPALYFTPYFLKKLPNLEFIIKNYYFNKMKDMISYIGTPEMYLISIFPFYSNPPKFEQKKINKENLSQIIKSRLKQSSYLSELAIECFKKQICSKTFESFLPLFDNYQQNSLAIQSQNNNAYYEFRPEHDESLLYYGLPGPISLKNNQDYYNFYEKRICINYPFASIGNARLNHQIKKVVNCFSLKDTNKDKLRFLIKNTEIYESFISFKECHLFQYILQKYSDDKVSIQSQLFNTYQSIFNFEECQRIYEFPLTLHAFSNELDEYLNKNEAIKKKAVIIQNPIQTQDNYINVGIDDKNQNKTTKKKKVAIKSKTSNLLQINNNNNNDDDDDDNDNQNDIKKKENTRPKTPPPPRKRGKNTGRNYPQKKHIEKKDENKSKPIPKKVEEPIFFIRNSNSPYFIIDSISNFINEQFDNYDNLFPIFDKDGHKNIIFFDFKYIIEKLFEDTNRIKDTENNIKINDNLRNRLHIENIIKMAIFGILFKRFHDVFKKSLPQFRLLSKEHLLFLFIFYKKNDPIKIINNKTLIATYKYIQKIPEVKVTMLSKLYYCSFKKNDPNVQKIVDKKYIDPPPFMFYILDQFNNMIKKA